MYDLQGGTVRFDVPHNRLLLLDQTRLPGETVVLALHGLEEMVEAIQTLRVRGAPALPYGSLGDRALPSQFFKFCPKPLHALHD